MSPFGSRVFRRVALGLGLAAGAAVCSAPADADDWARFRGPNGSGVSTDTAPLPTHWSPDENIAWKVELPGPGSSCPVVVGDKVFVTCWSGYGTGRGGGDIDDLVRHLICFDRATGKTLWDSTVKAVQPEDDYRGMFAEHGYASHTPVSDGERVYVFFGKSGALAFDMQGKQLWQTGLGTDSDRRGWGSACSPILYENLVIVTATPESDTLYGLDKETGKVVWKTPAEGFASTWGSPVLAKTDDRTDLVIGVPYEIWGFNPQNGKLRWFAKAMETDSFCSSVVAGDDGVVYGIEGRGGGSIAVKAGGKDDVTATNVVWTGRDSNRIGTPVLDDGKLYFVANKVANCVDAKTGERVYQARLNAGSANAPRDEPPAGGNGGPGRSGGGRAGRGGIGGQDYSSPVAGDGKLFYVTRGGEMYVLKLGGTFEQLAVNHVTTEKEDFSATPAIANGHLFIRSDKHLYCVGKK